MATDTFAALSSIWKFCDMYSAFIGLSKFSLQDLCTAFSLKRPSPLLVELHIGLLRFLFDQHLKTSRTENAVNASLSIIQQLQEDLSAVNWIRILRRYCRYIYPKLFEKVRFMVEADEIEGDDSNAELSYELQSTSAQQCKVLFQALRTDPNFAIVENAYKKNGEVLGTTIPDFSSIEKKLYSDYYEQRNGCNEFANDMRTFLNTCLLLKDDSAAIAADDLMETFERMFICISEPPEVVEARMEDDLGINVQPNKRLSTGGSNQLWGKRKREVFEANFSITEDELYKLVETMLKLEGQEYSKLPTEGKALLVQWLLSLVLDCTSFRQKMNDAIDDFEKFDALHGELMQKELDKRNSLVAKRFNERNEGAQIDFENKRRIAKRARSGKGLCKSNNNYGLIGRSFRKRQLHGWPLEGFIESFISKRNKYKCIYYDGSSELLSRTELVQCVLPTAQEIRQKKVSPSREIEICNSNETTPNTAENITNHTPSRRSDRKKPDVSYYEGPETPTKARTCPFLYLTIPVDGWVVNVGQVVDTRYGFGVVSEVRLPNEESACAYVLDMSWGKLCLSSNEEIYQVATLDEIDNINKILLEKARSKDIKEFKFKPISGSDETVEDLLRKKDELEDMLRYRPVAQAFGAVVWELDGRCIFENASKKLRSFDKNECIKWTRNFPNSEELAAHISTLKTTRRRVYSYANYKNGYIGKPSLPPLLESLPGLNHLERYAGVEAVRSTMLRLEANIAPYTRVFYRKERRLDWLKRVKRHSLDVNSGIEDLKVLASCLIEIETELMEGLGDDNLFQEQKKTLKREIKIEIDYSKRIYPEITGAEDVKSFLKITKFEPESETERFLQSCLKHFFAFKKIEVTQQQIDSITAWTRNSGIPALDAKLKLRYGHNLESTFTLQETMFAASRKPSDIPPDERWKVQYAAVLSMETFHEFFETWVPVRGFWRKSMSDMRKLDSTKLLHFALCLEQNVLILHKNLDFDISCRLFSDISLFPYPFQQIQVGDVVIYDHMRHEYALKVERNAYRQNRDEIVRETNACTFDGRHLLDVSNVWISDGPRPNAQGGRIREYQVFHVQYLPGGGEPYCVLTLGPKTFEKRVPDLTKESVVQGWQRTKTFCKVRGCRVYSLEGNYGYCEDHRLVLPKETKIKESESFKQGVKNLCYICLKVNSSSQKIACLSPECCYSYHTGCLEKAGSRIRNTSEWICPLHASECEEGARLTDVLLKILDRICSLTSTEPFLHPVSNQDGYHEVIERPICLQDIRAKAIHHKYDDAGSFLDDINLLVENCNNWCESRFPELPPVASRLKQTIFSLLKKENAFGLRRKKPQGVSLETRLNNENNETAKRDAIDEDDVPSEKRDFKTNGYAIKHRFPKRERKKRNIKVEPLTPDSSKKAIRKPLKADRHEDLSLFQPCGKCGNCIAKATLVGLLNCEDIRCVMDQRNPEDPDIVEIDIPPLLRLDVFSDRIWDKPPGFGFHGKRGDFFVVVVPLSINFAPFVLSRPGWQTIAKYESVRRENKA